MKDSKRGEWTWPHIALVAAALIGIGAALWFWHDNLWSIIEDQQRLRAWVDRLGPWGPAATIGLNVLQVILAPIPGQFVGVINGYLYGVAAGSLYSIIGLVIGTAAAMGLARRFGRPIVEWLLPKPRLTRWDNLTAHKGSWFFFLVFLFPFLPDDITSFLIGLSPLSIPRMLVLTTLGRMPGVFVSCWVGARASDLPWWAWIPLAGGATALAWLFWRYQERLENLMVQLIQWLTKRQRAP